MKISKLISALVIILSSFVVFDAAYADEDTFFDRYLENGAFTVRALPPTTEEEFYVVSEMFALDADHVQEIRARNNYNPNVGEYFSLSDCNNDWTHCTFSYNVFNNMTQSFDEQHFGEFDIRYIYDPTVKTIVDEFLSSVTVSGDGYEVKDMELLNYWLSQSVYYNTENPTGKEPMLPNFSSELKANFQNKNLDFEVDVRCGFVGTFASGQCGIGKVYFNGTYYRSISGNVEVKANHVFYVPSDTADEDLATALEERIFSIYGEELEGMVSVLYDEETPTVASIIDPSEADEYTDFIDDVNTEKVYYINSTNEQMGTLIPIVIKKDSDKLFTPNGISSTDIVTGVNISSDINTLPGDIKARVADLGANITKYTEALETEKTYTYDLGLRSDSIDYDVAEEEGHTFTVSVPVPENLRGLTLSAYFVDEDGKIEEYAANAESGMVVFEVPHFSVYTIAEASDAVKVPNTGLFTRLADAVVLTKTSGVIIAFAGALLFVFKKITA